MVSEHPVEIADQLLEDIRNYIIYLLSMDLELKESRLHPFVLTICYLYFLKVLNFPRRSILKDLLKKVSIE